MLISGKIRGRIIDSLGAGGFGSVYKIQGESNGYTAYKVCHSHVLDDKKMVQWFERGYKAMKRLNHPQIVNVNEGDLTIAPLGLYMQYIEGPNLFEYQPSRQPDIKPQELINLLAKLAQVIHYAHSEGVVHRDIKPQNILIPYNDKGEAGDAILTDFDLAFYTRNSIIENDAVKSLVATYNYASPEFRRNPEHHQSRQPTTDIYSFGQLMYFVMTGQDPDPMAQDMNAELLASQLFNLVKSASISDKFVDLYQNSTRTSPSNRIQTMQEIYHQLLEVGSLFDTQETIDLSYFTDQVFYRIIGPDRKSSVTEDKNVQYETLGSRFSITFKPKSASNGIFDATITCYSLKGLQVVGTKKFSASKEQLRTALRRTVEHNTLFECVVEKADYRSNFEVDIKFLKIPLSKEGIDNVTDLLKETARVLNDH